MQPRKREAPDAPEERWRASVARGLAEVFTGFELVDRDLDIGENRRVQWVGVEASGRLVLVLLIGGDGLDAIVTALDATSFVQRNRGVLAAHFESPNLRPELAPVVAIVAESFSDKLLGRLAGLNTEWLRLFEMRTLSSARGDHVYLAPVAPLTVRPALPNPRSTEVFVRALPQPQRELADLLLRRLARIDDQLTSSASERAVIWKLHGEILCSIAAVDERLEGQVGVDGRPRRIGSNSDVDGFVDQVLGRYVELLSHAPQEAAGNPLSLQPVEARALLSPEEEAAFRQPG